MRRRFLLFLLIFTAAFAWRLNVFLDRRGSVGPSPVEAAERHKTVKKAVPAKKAHEPEIAARAGNFTVTRERLDKRLKVKLWELRQQEYRLRVNEALEMLDRHLLEEAAKKIGANPDKLLADEIAKRYSPPTDEEVEDFYQQVKNRIGDRTRQEVLPYLKAQLDQQKKAQAQNQYYEELRDKAGAEVLLEPPPPVRLDVGAGDAPSEGPADAPITLIEFSDYQCPYCKQGYELTKRLQARYGKLLRVVFRDMPLSFHEHAEEAAEAAGCARDQGKFWPYHDLLFEDQQHLDRAGLLAKAEKLKLNKTAFEKCLSGGKQKAQIEASQKVAEEAGLTGAPAFLVNGLLINGVVPFDQFTETIDKELKEKGIQPPSK